MNKAQLGGEFRSASQKVDSTGLLVVLVLALFLVPSRLVFSPLGADGTPAVVIGLVCLVWYLNIGVSGLATLPRGPQPVRAALYVYATTVGISYVAGMMRGLPDNEVLAADRAIIALAAWLGIALIAHDGISSIGRLESLVTWLVRLGAVVALIGILEFFTGANISSWISIPGLSDNSPAYLLTRDEFNRPSSTAIHPIEFGVVMATLLPLALHKALDGRQGKRWLAWLPVALIGLALPMSVSRSAVVGAAVAFGVLFLSWAPRRRLRSLLVLVAATVVVRLTVHGLVGTIRNLFTNISSDTSTTARTQDYAQAWHYIRERPFFGRGADTFLPENYIFLDNQYLKSIVEVGVVGLVALLGLFAVSLISIRGGRRRSTTEAERSLGSALLAAIAASAVCFVTFDTFSFPMISALTFLLLGMGGAYWRLTSQRVDEGQLASPEPQAGRRPRIGGLGPFARTSR